jgi:hypothetical protein
VSEWDGLEILKRGSPLTRKMEAPRQAMKAKARHAPACAYVVCVVGMTMYYE